MSRKLLIYKNHDVIGSLLCNTDVNQTYSFDKFIHSLGTDKTIENNVNL